MSATLCMTAPVGLLTSTSLTLRSKVPAADFSFASTKFAVALSCALP